MKPAFVLQTHRAPQQIRRLALLLRRACPDSVVLVSHDHRAPALEADLFGGDPHVHVTRGAGGRGDFLILDGYLKALQWLEEQRIDYDFVTNLSGQDYPVASLARFMDDLAALQGDGYLHHYDAATQPPEAMAPMAWPPGEGRSRYWFQYRVVTPTVTLPIRLAAYVPRVAADRFDLPFRINTAYGLMLGTRARQTPFRNGFRCYAGSYWHTISRRAVRRLLAFANEETAIVDYFRRVLIPDESFVQTVLVNDPALSFEPRNRRYFDMSRSRRGHPKTLGPEDLPAIAARDVVFARKVDLGGNEGFLQALEARALA